MIGYYRITTFADKLKMQNPVPFTETGITRIKQIFGLLAFSQLSLKKT